MKLTIWLTFIFICPQSSVQQLDPFTQYVADSSMYSPEMDGSPPIELEYEEYYTPKWISTTKLPAATTETVSTDTTSSIGITNTTALPTTTTISVDQMTGVEDDIDQRLVFYSSMRDGAPLTCMVVLILCMLLIFIALCFINSDCYHRMPKKKLHQTGMHARSISESAAVSDVTHIESTKIMSRDIDGNVLYALCEESQEYPKF